jgi:Cu/Ag efflux pump CusA
VINGQPGVVLNVSGQYGANTAEVTRRVEVALAQLRPVSNGPASRFTTISSARQISSTWPLATCSRLCCSAVPPELKESHFIVHMATVPGTSIAESLRFGRLVTEALHTLPAVRSVAQRVGRAELADDTYGPHYSEFEVDLKPLSGDEAEAVQADIRNRLAAIPGANFLVYTFLSERIDETLSGHTASVVVNIFGDDLDVLDPSVVWSPMACS